MTQRRPWRIWWRTQRRKRPRTWKARKQKQFTREFCPFFLTQISLYFITTITDVEDVEDTMVEDVEDTMVEDVEDNGGRGGGCGGGRADLPAAVMNCNVLFIVYQLVR